MNAPLNQLALPVNTPNNIKLTSAAADTDVFQTNVLRLHVTLQSHAALTMKIFHTSQSMPAVVITNVLATSPSVLNSVNAHVQKDISLLS